MCRCEDVQICRLINVQICEFVNVQVLSISDYYFSQIICTSAYLYLYLNKKSPLVETRRLFNIFKIRLLTFTSSNCILNVIVMYNYFLK